MLRWQPTVRTEFERLVAVHPDTLTDLERAARFFYMQAHVLRREAAGRSSARRSAGLFGAMLATTLCLFSIRRIGAAKATTVGIVRARRTSRVSPCSSRQIRGRFILTINDVPEVREIFGGFTVQSVRTTYSLAWDDRAKQVGELIVMPRRA